MSREFVVFDAEDNEVEWYDPYINHNIAKDGMVEVNNGWGWYGVVVPGGGRYEIRPKLSVTREELLDTIGTATNWLFDDEGLTANVTDAVMELLRAAEGGDDE